MYVLLCCRCQTGLVLDPAMHAYAVRCGIEFDKALAALYCNFLRCELCVVR